MNIFDLIKQDHQEVASLFQQLRDAQGSRQMCEQLFAQLKEELELHAHAEEQVFYPAYRDVFYVIRAAVVYKDKQHARRISLSYPTSLDDC